MVKRSKVPAKLHSELSEYASLLRALRTDHTLDLASHLTHHIPLLSSTASQDASDSDNQVDDDEDEHLRSALQTAPCITDTTTRGLVDGRKKLRTRDTWTRWPLLAGDVYIPEWGLEDEIKLLAEHSFKTNDQGESLTCAGEGSSTSDVPQSNEEDDLRLSPAALRALAEASTTHLSNILALLAAHLPPAQKSMQNRVLPINWEAVLDIVAVNNLIDERVIEAVRERMQKLYPNYQSQVMHEPRFTTSSILQDLNDVCSSQDLSFLNPSGHDTAESAPKRKRGPYRKKANMDLEPDKRTKTDG